MTINNKSVLWNFAVIQVLPFLNNPKDLDLSYKTDLDFWDCFGKKKNLNLIAKEIWYMIVKAKTKASCIDVQVDCVCLLLESFSHGMAHLTDI